MRYLFILILLLTLGWNWDSHKGFIESSFKEFPDDLRAKLSLPLMQDGSMVPDRDFKDFTNHSYPRSIKSINYWFNISKEAFLKGDYQKASTTFGIASHYISDSLAAPHSVSGEDYKDHKLYEDQADFEFNVRCKSINLEEELQNYSKSKKLEWEEWLNSKSSKFPKSSSKEAANVVFSAALNLFDVKCENVIKEEKKFNWYWLILILVIILIIYLFYRKYF